MSSKALQDMTLKEFFYSVLTTEVGSTNCNWCIVPTEEARQAHIEHMIEAGYECHCEDGPRKCLEDTTVVVPGTEEFMSKDENGDVAELERMPLYLHVSIGNLAVQLSEAMKVPVAMMSVLYGLDPSKMDQASLEAKLAEASREVIENVDDFLASFDGEAQ